MSSATTVPLPGRTSGPIRLLGTEGWKDTGIDVGQGDRVTIEATGTVHHNPQAGSAVGPDGTPDPSLRKYNVLDKGKLLDGNHAALIAKVGNGDLVIVGQKGTLVAASPGHVWLGINDQGPDNNSGFFDVMVGIEGPPK